MEKISLAALAQEWFSDNSVSATITFSEDEAKEIPAILKVYDGRLKSISFLPMSDDVYPQQPYQSVSYETWRAMRDTR